MIVVDWKEYGDRVHDARRRKRMTQLELAERIGVNVNTLSAIERGVASPRLTTVLALRIVLGIGFPPSQGDL